MKDFKNYKELMQQLSDEKVCREYVEQMRWNGRPVCPHCGESKPYKLGDGKNYRCRAKTCKKDFSVLVGTIFEGTKIPLSIWLAALFIMTGHKKGISSCQLARDLGITQKSAWFVLHRLRLLMTDKATIELSETVEIDETYVGGKWRNRSKSKRKLQSEGKIPDDKIPVMGFTQRDGKATLKVIGNHDTFKDMVHRYVMKSATIVTDAHLAYKGLDETHAAHIVVKHADNEWKIDGYSTNTVEGFFSILKRGIYGIYHHASAKHLQQYCEEFSYRYNTRKVKDKDRFIHALTHTEGRLKYKDLIKKP